MNFADYNYPITIGLVFVSILFVFCLRSWAQAKLMIKAGFSTEEVAKRASLNPLNHIDLFGTVILPIALLCMGLPAIFSAKPVDVGTAMFIAGKRFRHTYCLVSLAIPVLVLLLSMLVLASLPQSFSVDGVIDPAVRLIYLSCLIFLIFDLIPLPPTSAYWLVQGEVPQFAKIGAYAKFIWLAIVVGLVVSGAAFNQLGPRNDPIQNGFSYIYNTTAYFKPFTPERPKISQFSDAALKRQCDLLPLNDKSPGFVYMRGPDGKMHMVFCPPKEQVRQAQQPPQPSADPDQTGSSPLVRIE